MIDTIISGAVVHPIGAQAIPNGAVAIRDGQIVAVGTCDQVDALGGSAARRLQLYPDQALIPSFHDSHQHLLSYVRSRTQLSLWDTTRLTDLLGRVQAEVLEYPPGTWVVAIGHDQGRLDVGRHPTLAELDAIAPHHPVLIVRACSHIGIANSQALHMAHVDRNTADMGDGRFERDATGELTGVLLESALSHVHHSVIAAPIDWAAGLHAAGYEYHRRGITAIGEAALGHLHGERDLDLIRAAHADGMRLRVYAMAYGNLADALLASAHADRPAAARHTPHNPFLTVSAIKYFIDGTLGGGTAFLTEEYGDEPGNRGWPIMAVEELEARVERAHCAGFQVAVHAIGDAAVEMVVDVYERVLQRYPRADHRHRIEHVEVVHAGLPERMARLGIVAGIQSCFTYWESGDVTRLGPGLAPWGHAWGSLLRAGVVLANGSDNPVLPDFSPLQGMYAAVTRTTHTGLVLSPEQAISPADALYSYTAAAAYAARAEQHIGRITPGMYADLVVLSADPCDPKAPPLKDIQVDLTMVGGEVVFVR